MQFAFTDEQNMIRESARTFFDAQATLPAVRVAADSPLGYDEALWRQMSEELGWAGIAIPQAYGGAGLGCVELAILAHEQGRRLVPSPFFATVCLAVPVIRHLGTEQQQRRWLPLIAAGKLRVAVALAGHRSHSGVDGATPELTQSAAGLQLCGDAHFVLGARSADLLLVVVHGEPQSGQRQCRVVALSPHVPGLSMRHHAMLDLTRPMSNLRFEGVLVEPADLLGVAVSGAITPGANAEPALERALDEAVIALSAEAVGGAEFTLEAATGFVKERVQFGRTIGSFQAIKHRLADMMVLLEAAKSVCWYAACAADELPPGELALAASAAKSCCADAFYDTAANAIQLHGGIGFTWDHHAHVYFRRARAAATLLGSPTWHRERVASLIGLDAGTAAPRG